MPKINLAIEYPPYFQKEVEDNIKSVFLELKTRKAPQEEIDEILGLIKYNPIAFTTENLLSALRQFLTRKFHEAIPLKERKLQARITEKIYSIEDILK